MPQLVHISSDITVLRADLGHSEIILCDMKTKVNRTSKRQDPFATFLKNLKEHFVSDFLS